MKKLICIGLFVVFTFLTGGIKYSYKIEHHAASLNLIWRTHKEEIRVLVFSVKDMVKSPTSTL